MKREYIFQSLLILTFLTFVTNVSKADVTYSTPLEGQEHQIGSLLNWSTANEVNSQVFIVERSVDGIDYQVIGEIDAAGTSKSENGYRFLDVGVNEKKSYYRLKQVDTDGTASFSQTILLKKEMTNNFMVLAMSNTVTNSSFTISVDAVIDDEIYYAVKDITGEIVFEATEELYYGINEITIDVENEAEGTYFIALEVNKEKEQLVIRKVDDEIKKKENVAASKKQSNGG